MKIKHLIKHIKEGTRLFWFAGISNDEYIQYLRNHGISVGQNVQFRNPINNCIDFTRPSLIELGNNLDINENFSVLTHDFGTFVFRECYKDFVNSSGRVKIGNNIVFGRNVTILKGVTVGDNCIIGAGSIVSKSIPSNSVAVGVPAKVICTLEEYYMKRKANQVGEALEYAKILIEKRGGRDNVRIEDFPEEWVLFLSEEEYRNNMEIRKIVDFRLKRSIDAQEFLVKAKPFVDFKDFMDQAIK